MTIPAPTRPAVYKMFPRRVFTTPSLLVAVCKDGWTSPQTYIPRPIVSGEASQYYREHQKVVVGVEIHRPTSVQKLYSSDYKRSLSLTSILKQPQTRHALRIRYLFGLQKPISADRRLVIASDYTFCIAKPVTAGACIKVSLTMF